MQRAIEPGAPAVALRDELEAILRGWNAYEVARGATPVIDFDLRPDLTRHSLSRAGSRPTTAALDGVGIGWGPKTWDELRELQGPVSAEEAAAEVRRAPEEFEPAVREATGATAPFALTVETADVDASWAYWLDGSGSDIRVRLNTRRARFTDPVP
jgi:hypothetical protein